MRVFTLLTRLSCIASLTIVFFSGSALAADDLRASYEALKLGHPDQALNKVSEFLSTHPKDAQARLLKGVILVDSGKTAEAIQVFQSMTEEMPELPEPYNNLAVIYASQGEYDKARTFLELALHTHPSYGTAHENLADVYAKIAAKSYEKALQSEKQPSPKPKLILLKSIGTLHTTGLAANSPALNKSGIVAPESSQASSASSSAAPAKTDTPTSPPPVLALNPPKQNKKVEPTEAPIERMTDAKELGAITDVVKSWAAAWSAKDADQYLSFYDKDFKTPKGESNSEWEKNRRERLSNANSIRVEVQDISLNMIDRDTAQVTFRQKYHSGQVKSSHHKVLVLKRESGRWLIIEERAKT
jgi:Tetratricopeptide repeat